MPCIVPHDMSDAMTYFTVGITRSKIIIQPWFWILTGMCHVLFFFWEYDFIMQTFILVMLNMFPPKNVKNRMMCLTLTGAVIQFLTTKFWTRVMLLSQTLVLFVSVHSGSKPRFGSVGFDAPAILHLEIKSWIKQLASVQTV